MSFYHVLRSRDRKYYIKLVENVDALIALKGTNEDNAPNISELIVLVVYKNMKGHYTKYLMFVFPRIRNNLGHPQFRYVIME